MQTRHLLHAAVILSAFSLQAFRLFSQQVAQPAPPAATTGTTTTVPIATTTGTAAPIADDEVVQLSPFTVTGAADRGFEALNTTSGSRVRTALKDTAASIQPFTNEFLDTIGASSVEDIMNYASNVEAEVEDSQQTYGSFATRSAGNGDSSFRIRGLPMGTALNYVPISFPMNRYNVDRIEISSGANSILFGMTPAGGMVNFTTAQANTQRNRLTIKQQIGTWTGTPNHGIPYSQTWLDYNIVLAPRKAALRIMGVYQDGGNQSWRYYNFLRDKRINPTIQLRPFKDTTINISYEAGERKDSPTINWNLSDGYTVWQDAGANPVTTFQDAAVTTIPGIDQKQSGAATPMFVLVDNSGPNGAPALFNYHRAFEGTKIGGANGVRLPADISSYYYNTVGPSGSRDQKFDRIEITLDQRLGPVNLQLAYNHNQNNALAYAPYSNQSELKIDPNTYISPPAWNGVAGTINNPNQMRYYAEDNWQKNIINQRYDDLRAQAEYTLDLKKFGRHRIIGVFEHLETEQLNDMQLEIYADQYQRPANISLGVALNNSNVGNNNTYIFRRNYVTWGDFKTYYSGDINIPAPEWQQGLYTYHGEWVNQTQNFVHVKSKTNSGIVILQSFFLKDRLATTLGLRLDQLSYKLENEYQVQDMNDPHLAAGTAVLGEYVLRGDWDAPRKYHPYTFTAGAVYHLLDWVSPFVNYSSNRASPYMDNRRVILTSDISNGDLVTGLPPPSEGYSLDYGVMLAPFNGKVSIRLTRFETRMNNDASIRPGGQSADAGQSVGGTNLVNIYNAAYNLTAGSSLGPVTLPSGVINPITGGNTQLVGPGAGPMTAAQYGYSPTFGFNSALTNQYSRGYEIMLTANVTKNLTLTLNGSYTQRERTAIMPEVINFYNTNLPKFLNMAAPSVTANAKDYQVQDPYNPSGTVTITIPAGSPVSNLPDGVNYLQNPNYKPNPNTSDGIYYVNVAQANNTTPISGAPDVKMSLYDFIRNQIWEPNANNVILGGGTSGGAWQSVAQTLLNQSGPLGARTWQFKFRARYQFDDGWLKGFSVSPGVRYASPAHAPYVGRSLDSYTMPPEGWTSFVPPDTDVGVYTDRAKMTTLSSLLFYDIAFGYRMKLFGGRTTLRLQLNIDNIFNNYIVTPSRIAYNPKNPNDPTDLIWTRTYLNPPRSYRLTATFDF